MFMIVALKKTCPFSLESRHRLCLPEQMSSRTVWLFSVLGLRMKRLCVTLNPFLSDGESFNCRAGPCHGLCERTWRHTKLWRLRGSLLFIAYPALRYLMAVRGSSPPLPLLRSQIMIWEDANGKDYNDYQLQRRSVYRTGSGGLIRCDTEMHLMFLMVLKKLTTTDLCAHTSRTHFSHELGPVQVLLQHSRERRCRKTGSDEFTSCFCWFTSWMTGWTFDNHDKKKTFVVLVSLTSAQRSVQIRCIRHRNSSKKICGNMAIKEILKGRLPVYGLRGKCTGDTQMALQNIPHMQSESGRISVLLHL